MYGGTIDYVCLPSEPEFGVYEEGIQGGSSLYGSMYRLLGEQDPFQRVNTNNQSVIDYGVPCALCMANEKWSVATFPALWKCPEGWKREYKGYLMTELVGTRARAKSECIDVAPEVLPERSSYTFYSHFALIESKCGSLPCPNYHESWELACAVCSK